MQYEAKHQELKDYATSFLNVCKTVTLAHQKEQCIMWNTDKNHLSARELDVSTGTVAIVKNLQYADILSHKLNIDQYEEVFVCHKVAMNGIEYCLQDVVIVGINSNDLHEFFIITSIVVYNENVLLMGIRQ